jgi:dipeptidase
MRKSLLWAALLGAVLLCLAAAVPAAGASVPAAGGGHARVVSDDCNFVIAGKDATVDGSVLMGYNNDWAPGNYMYIRVIPAPDPTKYQFVQLLTKGDCVEGGINEHQLGVCYGVATDIAKKVSDADPYLSNGWTGAMWDDILQQCRTAKQAIDLIDQMAQTRGFSGDVAGSFGIADPNNAWVVELLGGRHWVAARVPDNAFYAQPNMLRIRQIDLSRPNQFRGSSDLEQFAISLGRYNPASGPFDVAWAYAQRASLQDPYNTNRLWGAINKVAPSLHLDVAMPYADRPVFVVPDHLLSRQDITAIDRYHYEGTVLDQTQNYTLMSPHAQTDRPICYSTTDYSAVWQLRGYLPDAIGGVVWVAPSRPCSSAYVAFYDSITSVPDPWSTKTAYNAFRKVADSLDASGTVGGQIRYKSYIPLVRGTYGAFESDEASAQAFTELYALCLPPSQRAAFLTDYTTDRANDALALARSLPDQMP